MRPKIAPTLQRLVFDDFACGDWAAVKSELRAILIVVRADLAALNPGYRGQHEDAKALALARLRPSPRKGARR